MSAARMMRVQAVLFELLATDNGALAIRQLHFETCSDRNAPRAGRGYFLTVIGEAGSW
jgi:hypothetical protein